MMKYIDEYLAGTFVTKDEIPREEEYAIFTSRENFSKDVKMFLENNNLEEAKRTFEEMKENYKNTEFKDEKQRRQYLKAINDSLKKIKTYIKEQKDIETLLEDESHFTNNVFNLKGNSETDIETEEVNINAKSVNMPREQGPQSGYMPESDISSRNMMMPAAQVVVVQQRAPGVQPPADEGEEYSQEYSQEQSQKASQKESPITTPLATSLPQQPISTGSPTFILQDSDIAPQDQKAFSTFLRKLSTEVLHHRGGNVRYRETMRKLKKKQDEIDKKLEKLLKKEPRAKYLELAKKIESRQEEQDNKIRKLTDKLATITELLDSLQKNTSENTRVSKLLIEMNESTNKVFQQIDRKIDSFSTREKSNTQEKRTENSAVEYQIYQKKINELIDRCRKSVQHNRIVEARFSFMKASNLIYVLPDDSAMKREALAELAELKKKLVQLDNIGSTTKLYKRGLYHLTRGNLNKAVEYFQRVLALQPSNVAAKIRLSEAMQGLYPGEKTDMLPEQAEVDHG